MKKGLILLLLLFFMVGCTPKEKNLAIKYQDIQVMNLNDELELDLDYPWISENEEIVVVEEGTAIAVGEGIGKLTREKLGKQETLTIYVKAEITDIVIEGTSTLKVGETAYLKAVVIPTLLSQEVSFEVRDSSIVSINQNGKMRALATGMTTVTVRSGTFWKEHLVLVEEEGISLADLVQNNLINKNETVTSLSGYFKPLTQSASESVVGVSSYTLNGTKLSLTNFAAGLIYKRQSILEDGSLSDNNELENIKGFSYFVITSRRNIEFSNVVKIYYDENVAEITATVVAVDDKIDLAVLKFTSRSYFPIAKIGDSDQVKTGEFVFAIGHGSGRQFYQTSTMGVISYPTRYLSDDTDNDGVNDWDALYLQHDVPINQANNGGPLLNLKGEVIGINALKITGISIDNFGFAIPMNYVMETVAILETGQSLKRATLKVTVVDVKTVLTYPDMYDQYTIPDGVTYGFFIVTVDEGGIAHAAGMLPNDILISFNGIAMRYSYILRAEIAKHIIGSGETVIAQVYRNGAIIDLEVVY